jgi:hypothetical protein
MSWWKKIAQNVAHLLALLLHKQNFSWKKSSLHFLGYFCNFQKTARSEQSLVLFAKISHNLVTLIAAILVCLKVDVSDSLIIYDQNAPWPDH